MVDLHLNLSSNHYALIFKKSAKLTLNLREDTLIHVQIQKISHLIIQLNFNLMIFFNNLKILLILLREKINKNGQFLGKSNNKKLNFYFLNILILISNIITSILTNKTKKLILFRMEFEKERTVQ